MPAAVSRLGTSVLPFMQRLPGVTTHHQAYMPIYPLAFKTVDLRGYDLILSNKSGFCHGVPAPPGATHICYCLTPTRFLWQYEAYRRARSLHPAADLALRPAGGALRRSGTMPLAQRVHHFIAIFNRNPGAHPALLWPGKHHHLSARQHRALSTQLEQPGDYFLAGGRLIPYKRTDLAVRACSELGLAAAGLRRWPRPCPSWRAWPGRA